MLNQMNPLQRGLSALSFSLSGSAIQIRSTFSAWEGLVVPYCSRGIARSRLDRRIWLFSPSRTAQIGNDGPTTLYRGTTEGLQWQ